MFLMSAFPGVKKIDKVLNRRFEALTGLNTDTAEQLQVCVTSIYHLMELLLLSVISNDD
jgi:hypothetical protein